jgi:dTDP-4-dehydrorhamnose reductase
MTKLRDMRILITGVQGQVGFELAKVLGMTGATVVLASRRLKDPQLFGHQTILMDLSDEASLRDKLLALRPHIIINPAAYTSVDRAESEQELAFQVNARAILMMAAVMQEIKGAIIHFSTDYIYNPSHASPIAEDDPKNPPNVYASSKWLGEQALLSTDLPAVILRTSWVYGSEGHNFVKTMLRLGLEHDELRVVADQIGSPTYAKHLALAVYALLMDIKQDPLRALTLAKGAYNIADNGYTSWYEFACEIFHIARKLGMKLKVQNVQPIRTIDYPTPAQRPLNSRMSQAKIQTSLGIYSLPWQVGLEKFLLQHLVR